MRTIFAVLALLTSLPLFAHDPCAPDIFNADTRQCEAVAPPPPSNSDCPLIFQQTGLDQDINPLDGIPDSQNKACTSRAQGADCSWYKEVENRSQVTGQIFGYPAINGPFPPFSVNYSVWINAQPGTEFDQLTINADNVCISNVDPADLVVNGSNVYLNGVLQ